MSSTPNDPTEPEKKGGHAPAVKVAGGVRITQHRPPNPEPATKKDEEEEEELGPPKEEHRLVISGAVAHGDKDFPAEAVKAFHDKPQPAHNAPHVSHHHNIQQPRK